MSAPSSTVLNTSDQNYQAMLTKAMLTTEPLDTANIVDVFADFSTPFDYLTNSVGQRRPVQRPSVGMVLQGPRVPWSAWSCKSNFWLYLYETAVGGADVRTHTRVGRRELARE